MSDKKSLQPLQKTHESLQQIKTALTPFLKLLYEYHHQSSDSSQSKQFDKQEIAEAEAAVSLAMGTLRYMAQRLKGQGQSSKKKKQKDPLRLELDKMRRTLVECKSLRNSDNGTDKGGDGAKSKNQSGKKKEGSASKRRRSGDEKDTSTNTSPGKKLKIK